MILFLRQVVRGQKQTGTQTQAASDRTMTSGANSPDRKVSVTTQSQPSQPSQAGGPTPKQSVSQGTRRWTVTLPDGSRRAGMGEIPADILAMLNKKDVQTRRRWTVTLPDGTTRSGEGEIPADIQALLASQRQTRKWTVTLPDGSQRSGEGEVPADIKALLAGQGSSSGAGQRTAGQRTAGQRTAGQRTGGVAVEAPRVETIRRWTLTMPDGSVRSGTGDLPANLRALLDAQAQRSSGQTQGLRGPTVRRQWSITMPNGTVRAGTGDIPAHLQTLLEAQRATGGLRTQSRWSVTLPDGSKRSGVGDIPAEVQALMARGQGLRRRWRVRMPDGTMQSGRGAIPADLTALMEAFASNNTADNSLSRSVFTPPTHTHTHTHTQSWLDRAVSNTSFTQTVIPYQALVCYGSCDYQ